MGRLLTFFNAVKIALGLLPVLIAAIHAVEEAIPGEGRGEQKLAMIRAALQVAYDTSEEVLPQFETIWKMMAPLISMTVTTFNQTGVFSK